VLNPGGIAAFRELDFAASLFGSRGSAIETVWSTLRRSILNNDGYPDIGRDLPHLCKASGLQVTWVNPLYFNPPTLKARAGMYAAMGKLWEQADFVSDAVQAGWMTEADRATVQERLKVEAEDMSILSATTYVEVLARLPSAV
jgi:hypothetical protein